MVMGRVRLGAIVTALALAGTLVTAIPAAAQQEDADTRLRRIEAEVRALQRKVFPGGDGRFFTPEVVTPDTSTQPVGNAPATTAVTDLLGRMDSIEGQITRLTAQTEENANALALLTARVDAMGKSQQPADDAPAAANAELPPAAKTGEILTSPKPAKPVGPSAERVAAVQAILKPQTDDAGDDEYTYGFRLWEAKFYPEAEQQLRLFVEKFPKHSRISYGRNLLGRAYLDDGKPREAAPWFLQNYQADKQGARAADSLLYLSEAMIAIGDTGRACIALAEFSETYPALAAGRLASQYEANRAKVKCN